MANGLRQQHTGAISGFSAVYQEPQRQDFDRELLRELQRKANEEAEAERKHQKEHSWPVGARLSEPLMLMCAPRVLTCSDAQMLHVLPAVGKGQLQRAAAK